MSASIIENAVAEQNATPAQNEKVLKNSDNYKNLNEEESGLLIADINKDKTDNTIDNVSGFKTWQTNPYVAVERPTEETMRTAGVYELTKQDLYKTLAEKYGESLAYKTDVIMGHTRQTGWAPYRAYSAIVNNLNSMRVADTTKKLYEARISGDEDEAAKLEDQLVQQKYRAAHGYQPFEDEGWNTAAAFIASSVRNPEVLALSALGSAAVVLGAPAALAGAAVVGTGVAANALIFNDTFNLTMGELVPKLLEENPGMTEAEAYELAKPASNATAGMEVFFTALGASVTGGQMLASSRGAARMLTKMGIKQTGTKAIRDMPTFVKTYLKTQMPKTTGALFGEYAKETGGNITEEFMQQVASEAVMDQAKTGKSFTTAFSDRLVQFLEDPFAPENAELMSTIKNTAFGAGIVSGAMAAPGMIRNARNNRQPTLLQRSKQATNNLSFAQQLFDWRQKNPVAKQSPETDAAHSQALVAKGIAPKTVRIDRQVAEEILATPEFQEAAKSLKLQEAIAESEENGGTIDIDFVEYDKTVNSNKELFQKVRGAVSFTENSMSVNEFIAHLDSLDTESLSEISRARETVDSVYNQVYAQQMQIDNIDEKVARANAITAQLIANRIGAFKLNGVRTGEQAFENIEIKTIQNEKEILADVENATTDKMSGLRDILTLRGFDASAPDKQGVITVSDAKGKSIAKIKVADKAGFTKKTKTISLSSTDSLQQGLNQIESVIGKRGDVVAGKINIDASKAVVYITANANPTTLSHELFHWFSHEMQAAFNSGEMTEYWAKQVRNLARMVGAKIEDGKLTLTDTQEEHAANLFLEYIKEGKVANREIAPLFAYMQDLFRKACAFLKISGKLSKQADALFDAIFRAQDVIEHEQRMAGLVPVAKPDAADQELYDMYVGEMLASRMKATADLVRKREAAKKYTKSAKYEAIREKVKDNVIKELSAKTEYKIKALAAEHDNNALETFMAIQSNPDLAALDLPVEQIDYILTKVPNIAEAAEKETERRMLSHVQEEFRLQPEQLGLDESRNTAKIKALLAESLMRSGKTAKDFDAEYKRLTETADRQVGKTEIRKLKKTDYWDGLEANLIERYTMALGLKDDKAMAKYRRDQALVNAIRMRAQAISKRYDRFVAITETFEGAQQKIVHKDENGKSKSEYKYTAEAYDLLQSLLEKFGFYVKYARRSKKPVAEKMVNWIADQEETTLTKLGELRNYIDFINEGHVGDTDLMTGAEFDKFSTVFDGIKGVASGEFAIMLKSEKIFLSDMVAATREHFDKLGIDALEKSDNFFIKEFGAFGKWTNPEPVLRALFPASVMDKIWLPFIDSAVKAERVGNLWVNRYRAAKAKVDISSKVKTYSNGKSLTNQQVADLLLSMGNQHAYENFLLAFGLSEEQAETVVSEALTAQPQLADFAKEVWATYDQASEQLEQEFEERTNTLFVKKDHRAFEINGIQFGGGYVPARKALDVMRTDPRAANRIDMVHDKKFEKNVVAEADGNILSIIDITENELFQSAKQGFTAVEYNNVVKFMRQDGLHDTIGDRAYSFIVDWLQAYQMPIFDTSGWARPLASLSTLSALGFRATTMILQLSGLAQSLSSVGVKYFSRGLMMAIRNGEWAPVLATRRGAEKSDYMATRIGDPRSSLLGLSIMESVRAQSAKSEVGKATQYVTGKAGQFAMSGIQYFDTIVANVTWNAAYLKALDEGKSEVEARRAADSEVRVIQSDSLQISRSAAMQSQMARMITAFATWIMAMQSQLKAKFGTHQYGDASIWAFSYMVVSPMFESILKEGWASMTGIGDDDDKDFVEKLYDTWYNQIIDTLGTSIIPAANIGAGLLKAGAAGIELGITGENDIFKVYQANMPALQVIGRTQRALQNGIASAVSGDTDLRDKALINAASIVSSEGGKIVKMLLSGD